MWIDIAMEILAFTSHEDATASSIASGINAPYDRVVNNYIPDLKKKKLLQEVEEKNYKITDRGREILIEYRRFKNVMETYGLSEDTGKINKTPKKSKVKDNKKIDSKKESKKLHNNEKKE